MKLRIAAAGRAKDAAEGALARDYAARFNALRAAGLGPLDIVEVEERSARAPAARKSREASLLAAQVPPGAHLAALDESGRAMTSAAFAAWLARMRDSGTPALVFAIGGADGLDPAFRATAQSALALGPQTWPHLLVRAMLAEQIYRAGTILTGHPYHRA